LASSVEQPVLFTDSTYQNDNIWRFKENITLSAASGNSYIAVRYRVVGAN